MPTVYKQYFNQLLIFVFIGITTSCSGPKTRKELINRPNIVLIVADDLGYGDIGCYGGDIETPNIDMLASNGIRFSSFHTAPMCAPTRAMLLTGNDNHIAGVGAQSLFTDVFGYEGKLSDRIVTIPALLKDAGYHTYITGKWHLGTTPESNPNNKGFENSFVLLEGAGNHYNNQSALNTEYSGYTENGIPVLWPDGMYSTDFYTDKIIEYINQNKEDGRPFFAYAAYTSPHWPLQVDKKYRQKYKGQYDDGYEELRKKRLNSLKKAGIITSEAILPPLHHSVLHWDSLTVKEQKTESRKMEIYAGMVDNLDYNIGRLFTFLKKIGVWENTLFIFMSDNGAAHRDFYNDVRYSNLKEYYNNDFDNMGNENSYVSYGPQWAEAGSSPFRYFKDYATQGGINTTLIISGANVSRRNEIFHGFTSVLDLAPTFYELANVNYPDMYQSKKVYPLKGTSLLPFIAGETEHVHDSNYVFAIEHYGNAMLRKGNWKITNFTHPFKIENFGLYNLSNDLAEKNDIKTSNPEKFEELLKEWKQFTKEIKLQTPPPEKQ